MKIHSTVARPGELCLAVDIGGTKMAAGLVTSQGELEAHGQVPTPQTDDPEETFGTLRHLVVQLLGSSRQSPRFCGVGCGGPMTRGGSLVSPLNIRSWRGFPLRERLAQITGLPVFVDNDAKALALAEGWVGAAAGTPNFIAMVVSTGVGGGLVVDGRLLDGRVGNAGHIGHVVVEPEGRSCACGGRGCLEAEASGSAIAAITGRPPREAGPDVVRRAGVLVGRAVASAANFLDLDLAVVGGSVALGFGAPFFSAAQEELASRARLEFSSGARVVPIGLGIEGSLIGAGAVAWRAAAIGEE